MFSRLVRPKPVLDESTTEWIFDTFAWALEQFGTDVFYQETILVLPTKEYFPVERNLDPEQGAEAIFQKVRYYAGLETWPCELVAQDPDPDIVVAPAVLIQGAPTGPAGTFSVAESTVQITYKPDQIRQPMNLVATFAHELAHYLSATTAMSPPGGDEYEEFATDVLAVIMGFGIFQTNSAFQFSQFTGVDSIGWSVTRQGYLTQYELAYCLVVFAEIKETSRSEFLPFWKARCDVP